jgi:branched-chain amino acid transport system substrate-binding protein
LYDAIRRAGSADSQAIRDQIAQTVDFQGVSGKITIDENRNAQKGAVVLKIENGAYKFVELVAP